MEFRCFEIASGAIWVSSGTSMDMSHDINLWRQRWQSEHGLQVLKQVPCDPPRKFGVPRLHLVQFKHN